METQDVYLPVDDVTDLQLFVWNYKRPGWDSKEYLEKKAGVVVLTVEQLKEIIKEAKSDNVAELLEDSFSEDIDTVGKCANCGVEFHIHKAEMKLKTNG